MKHVYVYGLIDPNDYKVRYVGETSARIDRRLGEHIRAARLGRTGRVYDWLRALLPVKPWIVCLEVCEVMVTNIRGKRYSSAVPSEIKWIKRFRRDCLNVLTHEQTKHDWIKLTNP